VLLEGLPGLAKTLAVRTLAGAVGMSFKRIQFTPDLLPADVTGNRIFNPADGSFSVRKGPVFANLLLADEINRAPAKVQSALLEAMQERQVTIGEETFALPDPFIVFATQNPIEHEGTWVLPEAQVDRFMMKVLVGHPEPDEELEIMRFGVEGVRSRPVEQVVEAHAILAARSAVREMYVDERIERYIVNIVSATRAPSAVGLDDLARLLVCGASPRATINLNLAARAHALLDDRAWLIPDDVLAVAPDVLRHRMVRSFEAIAGDVSADAIVTRILGAVPVP
jgi:MoxR-like ATPase